jgi:hypothetical protein
MIDDRFDRELAGRLTAYESRLPDAQPPAADAPMRGGTPRWPLVGVGVLAAAAAILAVAVMLGGVRNNTGEASPSPSPSAGASGSPAAAASASATVDAAPASETPSPTVAVTPSPPSPTTDLAWTETASFPMEGGASAVSAVARHDTGLIAIGVAYDEPLPILGPPPPHDGRVWLSSDGTDWEDITPAGTFENTALRFVQATPDGELIVHGWESSADPDSVGAAVAFESPDGRTWQTIDHPFGDGAWPSAMAQGAQGSAAIVVEPEGPLLSVWWSADGRAWERVHDLGAQVRHSLGAGDEGFVVAGTRTDDSGTEEPFAIASGNGRDWFEADAPPGSAAAVAPRGGDWLAVSRDSTVVLGEPAEAQVWSSANGLSWAPIGTYPLRTVEHSDVSCSELPERLLAAGRWLVSGTMLSFGCSEGGVETKGTQLISLDGVDWAALPFAAPAVEAGLGTRIAGAVEVDGRLVLVGERDRVATFWVGERP